MRNCLLANSGGMDHPTLNQVVILMTFAARIKQVHADQL